MAREAERTLGRFVRNHATDNDRRGRVAAVGVLIGLAGTAAGIPFTIEAFGDDGGGTRAAGLLLGIGLLGLWAGVSSGLRAVRRHGEVYQLREGGLVYRRTGETRLIRWEDIRAVKNRGQDNAISRAAGWDVHCVLRIRKGRNLLLTGFTEDAASLVHTIERAVRHQVFPAPSADPPPARA